MTTRRAFTQSLLGSAALSAFGLPLAAQAQASLDMAKILVGFPPGGTTDALSRRVADKLRGSYASNVIVENKPGAGAQIAISALKAAPADGSTLLLTPSSMLSVYPFTYSKLPYTLDDLAPVSVACFFSHGFGVGPAVPASVKTIKDFVAWAKANPDRANFASPAAGSIPHLTAALFNKLSKADLQHVPYKGSAPGIQDLLGGQVSSMCSPVGDYLPHLKSGRLRLLATSGPQRSPFTPDVPTFKEQGIDISVREWYGFFLPAKASPEVRRRAAAYLQPALASKDLIDSMAQVGMEVQSSTPDQLAAWLKADADQWRGIVKEIGFSADS
ncbi:Bug family tripartite tricarboxylate transporter substrate binding protein [Malikia spinosa]|jgi:tripartite-type tricarboxylate transporter receptor subunit TctC|uniref:Twin-arginine translocation pathway signal protein n=1 Tax=Malikia spinosa TaxID=86180 RepID=A0A2S9KED7_9BURK|nr:Bug family tripartite tricarboxylate transporter substrate binding protein [Malikia spinosa]MYZ50715.1 twin-arginine translocation pathway signal protein [Malikia spinosa]OGB72405.1 MAG: twin-arginine translocation pathway signal protein [Burkholderiales bacterium RIFOXYC12_FULL_65_23]PRD68821.1 twin-arginine translocation pathway signal protein [Malikia spinosa]